MPYEPYDTGWIKSIYGGICLAWYLYSRGLLPHVTSVLCYNNISIPLVGILNKLLELIGNIIVSFTKIFTQCEATLFNHFNYIDPIYNGIKRIESMFGKANIDIGPPTFQTNQSNTHSNKKSTGKHLGSFFARKRRRRRQHVISCSIPSKNDRSGTTPKSVPPCSHPAEKRVVMDSAIDNAIYVFNEDGSYIRFAKTPNGMYCIDITTDEDDHVIMAHQTVKG
jgi:hypothetical protein